MSDLHFATHCANCMAYSLLVSRKNTKQTHKYFSLELFDISAVNIAELQKKDDVYHILGVQFQVTLHMKYEN